MNRSRCGRLMRRIWAGRYLYLMFLPVFLYYVIFRYGPMLGHIYMVLILIFMQMIRNILVMLLVQS